MDFHLISPLIYIGYTHTIQKLPKIPYNNSMKKIRQIHNIGLSIASFLMFIGITYGTYNIDKFYNINTLLCKKYNNDYVSNLSATIFLYSKYWEWLDTLFLHLSNKNISMLHYTHHMSTALLMYSNMNYQLSSCLYIPVGINCLVHIFMYWYFAFPKGFLYNYRKLITKSQIMQHIFVCYTLIYVETLKNCNQNIYGNRLGIFLYSMYLFYFGRFYINVYI